MAPLSLAYTLLSSQARRPDYAHSDDAGADLYSIEAMTLRPGDRCLVRTGIAVAIPAGYVGLIHPRSGMATKHGVTVLNAPGTIDSGYRGEICVNLINLDSDDSFSIAIGDRIAQLLIQQVEQVSFNRVTALPDGTRGSSGHGSSGGFGGSEVATTQLTHSTNQAKA